MNLPATFLVVFLCFTQTFSSVVWQSPLEWSADLPNSIKVFTTNSSFTQGVNMTASYCKIDLSDSDLEFKVVASQGKPKTPLQYIKEEPNHVYMIANGGYFNVETFETISLVIKEGKAIGSQSGVRELNYKNQTLPYYPTLGSFGVYSDGTPEIAWTYNITKEKSSVVYAYPNPSPNCFNCEPKPKPDVFYPLYGDEWKVKYAIGGGPVLIKNGGVDITNQEELVNVSISSQRHPRTAICITQKKEIITIVVDGRYSGSEGLYLGELANLMQDLGCEHALNLDGGGSSAMFVNGFLANHPSDVTGCRPVPSAIMVVSKTKKNQMKVIEKTVI